MGDRAAGRPCSDDAYRAGRDQYPVGGRQFDRDRHFNHPVIRFGNAAAVPHPRNILHALPDLDSACDVRLFDADSCAITDLRAN